ncbi:PREDICTED: phosphatidylinositol 4-kinase gamma 1-like [Tarenaya hassleriana]|uniref:phosphatidylinositol 4-kinase gamma 1-like n=1 Tax=Tarenaya hassleriana TaxID=28532 RepID=UPI00053C1526|nr:PREDICTED: phosphatidylinositol 4-kinase gamma 1-like [Tarenaya hassleriana]
MNCLAATIVFTCKPISDMAIVISSQRCRLHSLTNLDYNFLECSTKQTDLAHSLNRAFEDDNFHRSISTPCFSIAAAAKLEEEFQAAAPRVEILGGRRVPSVRALVAEVAMAMVSGVQPLLLPSGLGGAYLLRSGRGHSIAVAKPVDEEPLAFNNPKGSGGLMLGQLGMKRSVRVGETGIRELAAYLLDHQGFAGIPDTALVRISHVPFHVSDAFPFSTMPYKVASLQRFVGHDFDAGELGPGSFSVASVHRIGILDVRVLNLDRHAGNMLVRRCDQGVGHNRVGAAELVPIDHGLCLPECLDDPYFEWLNWPQASVPFTDSELQYISNLDPFKDAELLRTELRSIRESSIRVLIVCTIFLKQAAAAGLCLAEIGEMLTREWNYGEEERSSWLELLCTKAKSSMVDERDEDDDYNHKCNDSETGGECGNLQLHGEFEDTPSEVSIPANLSPALSSPAQWIPDHKRSDVREEGRRVGLIGRSRSHPTRVNREETGGVSFGDMKTSEWEMFLQTFQTILPEALEERSDSKGSKPRFGCSCEF